MNRSILAVVLCVVPILGAAGALAAHAVGDDDATAGIAAFTLGDFGGVSRATLETNALPYKVVATALVMRAERMRGVTLGPADVPGVFAEFGFVTPARQPSTSSCHRVSR